MPVSLSLHGVAELDRDLGRLARDIEGGLGGTWDDVAKEGEGFASRFAPRRTGRLASSFTGKADGAGAVVESSLIYSGVIDGGWRRRNIEPSHYSIRAATAWERAAVARVEQGVIDAIQERGLS